MAEEESKLQRLDFTRCAVCHKELDDEKPTVKFGSFSFTSVWRDGFLCNICDAQRRWDKAMLKEEEGRGGREVASYPPILFLLFILKSLIPAY